MSSSTMWIDARTGAIHFVGIDAVLIGGMAHTPALDILDGLAPHFGGRPALLLPYFSYSELTEIRFNVELPNAPMEEGWPTKTAIEAEIAFVRAELYRQLGLSFTTGKATFPWGAVWSLFDTKGVQAMAGVRWISDAAQQT